MKTYAIATLHPSTIIFLKFMCLSFFFDFSTFRVLLFLGCTDVDFKFLSYLGRFVSWVSLGSESWCTLCLFFASASCFFRYLRLSKFGLVSILKRFWFFVSTLRLHCLDASWSLEELATLEDNSTTSSDGDGTKIKLLFNIIQLTRVHSMTDQFLINFYYVKPYRRKGVIFQV